MLGLSMPFRSGRFLSAAIVLFVAVCSPVRASAGDDDNFFEKGFAGDVLEKRDPENLPKQGNPKLPGPGKGKATPKPSAAKSGDGFVESGDDAPPDSIVPEVDEDPNAIEIFSIDAVVNFTKVEHAKEVAKFIADIAHERKIRFNKVYALGSKNAVLNAMDAKARIAFTTSVLKIVKSTAPPPGLPVKGSPSWVIHTSRGRYIAEGTDALERLTTKSGRLKWPKEAGGPPVLATPIVDPVKRQEAQTAETRIQELVGALKNPPKRKGK